MLGEDVMDDVPVKEGLDIDADKEAVRTEAPEVE